MASKASKKQSVDYNSGNFGQGVEIIHVREKHGYFRKAVPTMPLLLAIPLCIVNVLLPGVGTLLSAFTPLCGCKTEYARATEACAKNILAALLQAATFVLLVGWIWSIYWGACFIHEATSKQERQIADAQV